jgi:hypothetical protein
VFGKGLTFDFFSDPLVRKAVLVTAQCADSIITSSSTYGKDTVLPRRKTWTVKNTQPTLSVGCQWVYHRVWIVHSPISFVDFWLVDLIFISRYF